MTDEHDGAVPELWWSPKKGLIHRLPEGQLVRSVTRHNVAAPVHLAGLPDDAVRLIGSNEFTAHWGVQASDGVVFGCHEATAANLCPDGSIPVSRLVGPWTPATPQPPETT